MNRVARLVSHFLPARWGAALQRNPFLLVAAGFVGLGVLMRLNNGVRYPALHGYDSFGHVTYIWYLLKTHSLPTPSEGWSFFHPPLYYTLCAGIWWLLSAVEPRQVLKVISTTFSVTGLGSALVSYAVARRYFAEQRLVQFLAPAFILFLPVHIYTAPMLGNESLNTLLCSVALYFLLRTVQTQRPAFVAALGVTLGLALLTKFTSVSYIVVTGLVLGLWGLHSGKWRVAFAQLCIVGVLVLAVAGWFYVRNVRLYGTPFQMSREYFFTRHVEDSLATGQRGITAYLTLDRRIFYDPTYMKGPVLDSVWTGAFANTWFDAHGNWFLPNPQTNRTVKLLGRYLLILGLVPTLLVLLGLATGVWRLLRRGWDDTLVTMFTAIGIIWAMFVAYTFDNRIYTAVKASYMLPAVVPFSFWFALGVSAVAAWGRAWRALVLVPLLALVALIVPVYTYQLLFEVDLGPHHWNSVAVIDYFAGFRDRARHAFEATATGYRFYLAHENLGSMALEEGDAHQALFEIRRAMRLLPAQVWGTRPDVAEFIKLTRADYENSLGVIYERLGWADLAFRSARDAVTLDPALPEAHYNFAVLLIKRGLPEAAIDALQRALELDPGFADAHVLLGVGQQRAGDCAAALTTLEQAAAVKEWPRRTYAHATGTGDVHDAAIVRRRQITDLPPSANADYALAVCRAQTNDVARAGHDLAQALSSGRLAPGALLDDAWRRAAGGALVPLVLPNIIVIMIDTLRADHVGAYGYARPTTPHLDQLAAQGVRFANAFSTSSWTSPAVGSLFTGLLPSRHGLVSWQTALAEDVPTLAEQLTALGYHAAAFSANFVAVSPIMHLDRGFAEFQALSRETSGAEYSFDFHGHRMRGLDARELTETVETWLAGTEKRPIFLYVHYLDPHPGYQPPEADARLFATDGSASQVGATAGDITELERSGRRLDAADVQHLVDLYDGEIHFTDAEVAGLLDRLKRDGFCENCVVAVLADHGEEFQDHGHFWHSFTLYDEMLHIPLILYASGPWSLPPRVVPELVQITDLFPTLIEMAGGTAPTDGDGRSLLPLLRHEAQETRATAVAELDPDPAVEKLVHPRRHRLAVRDGKRKVIIPRDGGPELYRIDRDAGERQNVAASEGGEVARLLALANPSRTLRAQNTTPALLSAAQREQMRALGYLP